MDSLRVRELEKVLFFIYNYIGDNMKSNVIEMIVVLLVFLFIFVTLVVFYENKIDELEALRCDCNVVSTISE